MCNYVSRASVATCLRCDGIFNNETVMFTAGSQSERILKIGCHWSSLLARPSSNIL